MLKGGVTTWRRPRRCWLKLFCRHWRHAPRYLQIAANELPPLTYCTQKMGHYMGQKIAAINYRAVSVGKNVLCHSFLRADEWCQADKFQCARFRRQSSSSRWRHNFLFHSEELFCSRFICLKSIVVLDNNQFCSDRCFADDDDDYFIRMFNWFDWFCAFVNVAGAAADAVFASTKHTCVYALSVRSKVISIGNIVKIWEWERSWCHRQS